MLFRNVLERLTGAGGGDFVSASNDNKRKRSEVDEDDTTSNSSTTSSAAAEGVETKTAAKYSTTPATNPIPWKVVRLAARDIETRKRDGGCFKAKQKKISCEQLEVKEEGVIGVARGRFFVNKYKVKDFNFFRTQGKPGEMEPGTKDRAVSISTVSAYKLLQEQLDPTMTIAKVEYGDLGENILLDGPLPLQDSNKDITSNGIYVGAQLKIGSCVLEITECNKPCYRFNTQSWAMHGKSLWGKTAPEGITQNWFKSPECPLNNIVNPGIRGWLAKVIVEGDISKDDVAVKIETEKREKKEPTTTETTKHEDDMDEKKDKDTEDEEDDDDDKEEIDKSSSSPKKKRKIA